MYNSTTTQSMLLTSSSVVNSVPTKTRMHENQTQSRRFSMEGVMDFGTPTQVSVAKDALFENGLVCIMSIPRQEWVYQWLRTKLRSRCNLYHPHSLKIYDTFITGDQFHLIFEYPQGESLLRCLSNSSITEEFARNLFQQMIFAVDYYHRMGIDGLDLSLERIFFDSESHVLKIIDFGLIANGPNGSASYALPYIAPEQLSNPTPSAKHNKASDVWHCGVLLYCMLFRSFPFPATSSSSNQTQIINILGARWQVPRGYQLSNDCFDLLSKMLTRDPSERITLNEIKRHPWYLTHLPSGVPQYQFVDRPQDGLVQKVDVIGKTWSSCFQP